MDSINSSQKIKIKMYPANVGDAFLVTITDSDCISNIIIDMGLSETYQNKIKPDLLRLNESGMSIDLLVVTHIDEDHIQGAIDFFTENGSDNTIIRVKEVWYNSLKHITREPIVKNKQLKIPTSLEVDSYDEGENNISAKQGTALANILEQFGYNWNTSTDGNAINIDNYNFLNFSNFSIELLSPNTKKLDSLNKFWKRELKANFCSLELESKLSNEDKFEQVVIQDEESVIELDDISSKKINLRSLKEQVPSVLDKRPPNGSSIAFIIHAMNKKFLFLADAHPDIIFEQLINKYGNAKFDAIKLPHHGSNKNLTVELANILNSNLYFVSTNGSKHDHPNLDALAKIITKEHFKKIAFNYANSRFLELEYLNLDEFSCELVVQEEFIF